MPATVLAFDPGGTTGWARMSVKAAAFHKTGPSILSNICSWEFGQLEGPEVDQVAAITAMIAGERVGPHAVVFEDFQLRTLAAELSPVRITAAVEFWLHSEGRPRMHLQMPALAKSTATDDRLKRWGLYQRGQEHARDATRHAITFLRRAKADARLRSAAWPSLGKQDS